MADRPAGRDDDGPGSGGGELAGAGPGLAQEARDALFLRHRGMVFTIAYDVLGTVSDAEDVVQETYLRWRAVDGPVDNPRAYLARIASRQALNSLRSDSRRREDYPGDWLPEPLPTGPARQAADPEAAALTASEVSTAMLVLLQTLGGPERAAFILHEVFDFGYPEIAATLDAGEPAVRQMVHRARTRLRSGPPRTVPDTGEHRAAVERFLAAAMTGQVQALLDVLTPDAVLVSDGGGKARASMRAVYGPEKVARLLLGLAEKYAAGAVAELLELNGLTGVAFREAGRITTVFQVELADGRVRAVYSVRNPDKLAHLQDRGA